MPLHGNRLIIQPRASRYLRAILLLLLLLSLVGISQTQLSTAQLLVALLALAAIFAEGWRRSQPPRYCFTFDMQALGCRITDSSGTETELNCVQASVYPWLVILRFSTSSEGHKVVGLNRPVLLLPDSLVHVQNQNWRRLLVWAHQMRRQLASH